MKPAASLLAPGILVFALAACQEKLSSPVECPELCPGTSLVIRDTVLDVLPGTDSTFTGFVGNTEAVAMLAANGLDGTQARAYWTLPRRSDSVFVDGLQYFLTVDSVGLAIPVVARDTMTRGVKIYLYRIQPDLDSTATVDAVDAGMTDASLIDSLAVPDTLKSGTLRLIVPPAKWPLLAGLEADEFRVGIGARVGGPAPTGIRLGSLTSSLGAPGILAWGKVAVLDTNKVKQSSAYFADKTWYAIDAPALSPGSVWVGGKSGARTILRFRLPTYLRDTASVLRATLQLTPVVPLRGLRGDTPSLEVRGVLTDLGAKSPVVAGVSSSTPLPAGTTGVLEADVRDIVTTWFGHTITPPTSLMMALQPEGASFTLPEFHGSGSANAPRIRLTYAMPSRPGHP